MRPDFIPFTLPYICAEAHYDYKPDQFQGFPHRQGWVLYGEPGKPEKSDFSLLSGIDSSEMLKEKVAFLQAWMFFGVLAEASSIYGLDINIDEEFLISSGEDRLVTTEPLNGMSERWIQVAQASKNMKERCAQIWKLCQFLECRIFDLRDKENRVRLYNYDECQVLFSIEIVYRTVLLSLVRSGQYEPSDIRPLLKTEFFDYQLKLHRLGWTRLRRRGWCHSEMKTISALNRKLPYAFLASTIDRYPLDHSECDDFQCKADQINEDTYETIHVDPGCTCAFISINVTEVCSSLSRGHVPLISVSSDLTLKVVEERPFIAISHVWSHGLGNPRENAIPRCKLREIQQYLSALDEEINCGRRSNSNTTLAFWLDTLCIPVTPELQSYRKKAIKLMGQTYRSASAVLVLDRELKMVDPDAVTTLEYYLWLTFSGWMRRLWTLQEAALAHELFIQMKNGPVRFSWPCDEGVLSANKWKRGRLAGVNDNIEAEILLYHELELFVQRHIPPARYLQQTAPTEGKEYQTPYQYLCAATERRCTSKLQDEPLILATMTGHDVSQILKGEDMEAKMAAWHQAMREIPAEIIFLHTDIRRLTSAPFRWAPSSLMQNEIAAALYRGVGICTSEGLQVQYAAYILSEEQERTATTHDTRWYLRDSQNDTIHKIMHNMDCKLPQRCAILFDLEYNGDGAVAEITEERQQGEEILYVGTIVGRVSFFRKRGLPVGKTLKSGRDIIDCKRTDATQKWCIT